jgi:hypothetical protein
MGQAQRGPAPSNPRLISAALPPPLPAAQLMARNGRLIVLANEEDDEMVDIVAGKYPIVAVPRVDDAVQPIIVSARRFLCVECAQCGGGRLVASRWGDCGCRGPPAAGCCASRGRAWCCHPGADVCAPPPPLPARRTSSPCSCCPTTSPACAATTWTSPATWPSR